MSVKAQGNGNYRVRVYNPYGPEFDKVVKGKRAADALETEVKAKFARGGFFDVRGAKRTFKEYALSVVDSRNLAPRTRLAYLRYLKENVFPRWGGRPMESLRHSDAVALETHLYRTVAESTAYNTIVLVRGILKAAVADGVVNRHPFAQIKTGKRPEPEQFTPGWDLVKKVAGEASPVTAGIIQGLAGSGLRAGEFCGLTVTDVDFLRGRSLTVRQQLQWMSDKEAREAGFRHGGYFAKELKTDAGGGREVPLAPWTLEGLSVLAGARPAAVQVRWGSPDSDEWVELDLLLGLLQPSALSSRVAIFAGRHGGRFSPHGLRRLAGTTWEQEGVPLRTVQYLLGHEPQGVTMSRYVKVTPGSLELARSVMVAAWDGPVSDVGVSVSR